MKIKYLICLLISSYCCFNHSYGQLLFDKKYIQTTNYQFVRVDSIGNIYIAGATPDNNYKVFIEKFDSTGNILWGKITPAGNLIGDLLILNNQKIILSCNNSFGKSYI